MNGSGGVTRFVRVRLFVTLFLGVSIVVAGGAGGGWSLAKMTDTATTSGTFGTGTIFPGVRTVSAWSAGDSSSGVQTDVSDSLSFSGDGRVFTSGNFAAAFATTRYEQWDFNGSIATGIAVSTASFNFRVIPASSAQTTCWYIEVRRTSTNALLATHGSAASPYACATGSTYATVSVNLPEVTTTTIADDLRIKLFANETAATSIKIDLATVTGTTAYGAYHLYENTSIDSSTTTPVTTPWSLATVDATALTTSSNWTTAFAATRYLLFTFDPGVPTSSVITNATLTHVYKSSTAVTTCYYFEVYSGATLLGTHGSAATPVSCATNAAWVTDTITLAEVNSVARANGVQVKMYVKNSGSRTSLLDQVLLSLTYSRP
jgi:hypothetical protein